MKSSWEIALGNSPGNVQPLSYSRFEKGTTPVRAFFQDRGGNIGDVGVDPLEVAQDVEMDRAEGGVMEA